MKYCNHFILPGIISEKKTPAKSITGVFKIEKNVVNSSADVLSP